MEACQCEDATESGVEVVIPLLDVSKDRVVNYAEENVEDDLIVEAVETEERLSNGNSPDFPIDNANQDKICDDLRIGSCTVVVHNSDDDLNCSASTSNDPYMSLNTQIMCILDDLEHALDSSLANETLADNLDFDNNEHMIVENECNLNSSNIEDESLYYDIDNEIIIADCSEPSFTSCNQSFDNRTNARNDCDAASIDSIEPDISIFHTPRLNRNREISRTVRSLDRSSNMAAREISTPGSLDAKPSEDACRSDDSASLNVASCSLVGREIEVAGGDEASGYSLEVPPVMCDSAARPAVRRDSMRLLRQLPLPIPSAPPPPEDEQLPLPVLLFMERNSCNFTPSRTAPRPSSADDAPRILGRRALTNTQRSVSLHVSPSNRRSGRSRGWRNSGGDRTRSSSASSRSRTPRSLSSDSCSLTSIESTSPTSPPTRQENTTTRTDNQDETQRNIRDNPSSRLEAESSPLGTWPHGLSSMLACLGCTLGIFNISRFAIFSVHFGANFIVQFLILSLILGIPLFTLHLCLGQLLCSGPVDMWKISPLFQGVGIALLIAQSLVGIYSIIGISWLFVYFRDSFITKMDRYRWAEPFGLYRDDVVMLQNGTFKLSETVPDYFNGIVLSRYNIGSETTFGNVKFQLTFNLAVVWMIVFVSLSKGLRSYGKVVYVFSFLPVCGTLVLCAKLLSLTPHDSLYNVFPETSWSEFFLNNKSWTSAAQESFLTWGLLGACVMQITSHNKQKGKPNLSLQRDCICIILLTISILLLAAFLANTCLHIINDHGYSYVPGSFEQISTYTFLKYDDNIWVSPFNALPVRYMSHQSCLVGTHIYRPGVDSSTQSGYQVLQLATELVPSTLAIVGPDKMSSFWAVLFYFILIMFGVAQQLAIWHCVITGIMAIKIDTMKSWETTVTFFSCAFGFTLGLPMTTDAGIQVVHFLDYVIVGGWWHCLLYVILICAVFLVRGRPYSGDTVVTALYPPTSKKCTKIIAPLLSFTWNVILPIVMIALCIIDFRAGKYRQLYSWRKTPPGYEYWSLGCKKLGAVIQLLPILVIPLTGFIQTWRYIASGPPDILDRIQLLYRPSLDGRNLNGSNNNDNINNNDDNNSTEPPVTSDINTNANTPTPQADPPPKYTPPPSYSTATGARIAKMLRQSLRRSIRGVRRLANSFGESSSMTSQIPMSISESISNSINTNELPPPDYSLVLANSDIERNQIINSTNNRHRNSTQNQINFNNETELSTVPFRRNYRSFNSNLKHKSDSKITTAVDVANLLRSSIRRSLRVRTLPNTLDASFSQENLINQAEPISITTIGIMTNIDETDERRRNIRLNNELENATSVI